VCIFGVKVPPVCLHRFHGLSTSVAHGPQSLESSTSLPYRVCCFAQFKILAQQFEAEHHRAKA